MRVRLVGHAHVERGAIDLGVNGDGGDPHLVERARDADGNLATVCDENLAEGLGRLRHGRRLAQRAADTSAERRESSLLVRPKPVE